MNANNAPHTREIDIQGFYFVLIPILSYPSKRTLKVGFSPSKNKLKWKTWTTEIKFICDILLFWENKSHEVYHNLSLLQKEMEYLVMSRAHFSWCHSKAITKCYTRYASFKSITKQVILRMRSNSIQLQKDLQTWSNSPLTT